MAPVKPQSARSTGVMLLLIIVCVWGVIISEASSGVSPQLNRVFGTSSSFSPTMTYSGYLAISFYGTYQYVTAVPVCHNNFIPCLSDDQTVFYLQTSNGMVRLIFYCRIDYCDYPNQIGLPLGTHLIAKGTLLVPSKWPRTEFEPALSFAGDLYVFNYTLA